MLYTTIFNGKDGIGAMCPWCGTMYRGVACGHFIGTGVEVTEYANMYEDWQTGKDCSFLADKAEKTEKTLVGFWADPQQDHLKWFGHFKYGQVVAEAGRMAPDEKYTGANLTFGQVCAYMDYFDEFLPNGMKDTKDKYFYFSDLMKWAVAEKHITMQELHDIKNFWANMELA